MTHVDRRQFLAAFAATGLSSTLLPGILWAQIQPGTRTITVEMIRESARLAGIAMSDEEARDLATSLSSLSKHAEQIDKPTLTNASPLPLHFDPRPHGIELAALPPALLRIEAVPPMRLPASLEAVAFWPLTQLARLLRTRAYREKVAEALVQAIVDFYGGGKDERRKSAYQPAGTRKK